VTDALGSWDPLTPGEVVRELEGVGCPWWLAGGWAIDLHLGRQTREHGDIDVVIPRADQQTVRRHLAAWDLHAADPPGTLRLWRDGEILPSGVHDVWCRRTPASPWCLQLMIDDMDVGTWRYRRDPRITRPVAELDGPASSPARRVLAPDVQLLYKSASMREKDQADFTSVVEHLDASRRRWLADALALTSPEHPWLEHLRAKDGGLAAAD
jgi:hypothetical protein